MLWTETREAGTSASAHHATTSSNGTIPNERPQPKHRTSAVGRLRLPGTAPTATTDGHAHDVFTSSASFDEWLRSQL